ncbi:hypothetical protein LCGC14_1946530 [marine sediment metagenome]|uniref:Uncharacterized protein n=1 Tax=marine sediment metagenome TaxID=412755 RepID=A0A0F9G755_9ZZZZ
MPEAEQPEQQPEQQTQQQPTQGLINAPSNVFAISNRERQRKEQMVEYLGQMLEPETDGFPHINMDMSFTNLNFFDLFKVDNISEAINLCHMLDLKQSEYLFRGELATILISRRSRDARSFALFTDVTTKSQQTFKDETEEKKGFSFFNFGKKKS